MSERTEPRDRLLVCTDCGERFTWSAAEQAFFREKGFQEPRRCKPCRQAKKGQRGVDRPGGGGKAA